ncbi:hypothetical protein [Luteitalea sp.]
MNRRQGVFALLASTIAAYMKVAEARPGHTSIYRPPMWTQPEKHRLIFPLDQFKDFEITCGDRRVLLTPVQLMDALEGRDADA